MRPKVAGGDNNQDAYLAYQQILGTLKVTYDITVSGAGGYLFYPGHGGTGAAAATTTVAGVTTISTRPLSPTPGTTGAGRGAGNSIGQNGNVLSNRAPFNSANSSRNLSIGTFHGDVKLGLGKLKLKVYGQAAYNLQGGQRDSQEYGERLLHDDTVDKLGFATGLTIGSDYQIEKGGFVLRAEYRQVGLGSVDPNLNDSDWNFSRLGFRGIKVAGSYGFYPWPDPNNLRLQTPFNGKTRQDWTTGDMIFNRKQLVTFCASILTIKPDDILFTGTPQGVVFGEKKPAFLRRWVQPGDQVVSSIEGLGALRVQFT